MHRLRSGAAAAAPPPRAFAAFAPRIRLAASHTSANTYCAAAGAAAEALRRTTNASRSTFNAARFASVS